MNEENKEIVEEVTTPVEETSNVPAEIDNDLLKDVASDFADQTDSSELKPPRIKIMQKMSSEMDDDSLSVKQGMLVNSLSKRVYEKPLKFIPIRKIVQYIRYNAQAEGQRGWDANYAPGALIYIRNTAAECGDDAQWIDGQKPPAQKHVNFLSYLPDYSNDGPVIVSFKGKTGLKQADNMTSLINLRGNIPFKSMFALSTAEEESNGNKYHVGRVQDLGLVDGKTQIKCSLIYKDFADLTSVHIQHDEPTTQGDTDTPEVNWEE